MTKISFVALLVAVCSLGNACAASKGDGADYKAEWGIDSYVTCQGSGKSAGFSDSDTGKDTKWHKYLRNNFMTSDNTAKGVSYYIAREMQEHGYKFCRTIIAGDRSDCGSTITTYYNDGDDCFWLCKPGHYPTSEGCTSTTMSTTKYNMQNHKDRQKYATGSYRTIDKTVSGSNIEGSIPMFWANINQVCKNGVQVDLAKMTNTQEHDAVLAIKKITYDEKKLSVTYTVQPLVVRAGGAKGCHKADDGAWPMLYFSGNTNATMCPEGFLAMESGVCEAYDENVHKELLQSAEERAALEGAKKAAEQAETSGLAILCPGFPQESYNNAIHELNSSKYKYTSWRDSTENATTCTIFVCKDFAQGYKSDPKVTKDFTCVNCKEIDEKVNPMRLGRVDGVCTVCPVGKIYDSTNGICAKAKGIHKYYMSGMTKNGGTTEEASEIKDQCWTKGGPDEYKKCMASQGWIDVLDVDGKKPQTYDKNPKISDLVSGLSEAKRKTILDVVRTSRRNKMSEAEIEELVKNMIEFD